MMKKLILNLGLLAALTGALCAGEIITYQGRLKESGSPANGNRNFVFDFCAAADGTGCIASASGSQPFQVVNGLFRSTFTAPTVDLGAGPWYLRVWVNGTALSPVERLTHVPYAVQAASSVYASALAVTSGQGVYASTNVAVSGSLTVSDFSIVPSTEAMVGVSTVLNDLNPAGEDIRVAITGYAISASPDPDDVLAAGNFEAEVPAAMNGMMVGVRAVNRNYGSSPKAIGLMVDSVQNSGTLGETYGIWIATMTGGTQNSRPYALYSGDPNAASYFAGPVGISSVPAYSLAVSSGTGDLFWVAHDAVHAIKFVGDGSGLTGVTGASGTDSTKVLKAGDTMTGQLTLAGSTLTVTGNSFSVGTTGLVVTPAGVGVGTFPSNPFQVSAGGSQYVFAGNSTSADATMNLVHNAGGVARINDNSGTNAAIALALGHVNHVLLNNAGDLGIGGINPSYRLHVSSGPGEAGTVLAVSTGATNVFWVAGDGAHSLKFYGDGSALTGINADLSAPIGTLAIADGGTGGTTAADARTNLGAVSVAGDTLTGPLAFSLNNAVFSNSINTGGIVVSTGGAITTTGQGTGAVAGNARGLGAVDLQTARGAATQVAGGNFSVIGGGIANSAPQSYATVGGGFSNYAGGDDSTVSGGYSNGALGYASAVGGGAANSAPGTMAAIAGGDNNSAQGYYAAMGGGAYNAVIGSNSVISGGKYNVLHGTSAVIGGGEYNSASGMFSAIAGGISNAASSSYAAVGGGNYNSAAGMYSAAAGGNYNSASGQMSAIGGGNNNSASGGFSAIPGGDTNQAMGLRSFAAGFRAQSTNDGTFTWADSEGTMVLNSVNDRARFKARGGFLVSGSTSAVMAGQLNRGFLVTGNGLVGISTGAPQAPLDVVSDNSVVSLPAQIWRDSSGAIVSSMSSAGHMMAVRYVGDGSGLTNVAAASGTDSTKVLKTGDTMTGQLTLAAGSTFTVTGNSFSVGSTGLSVSVSGVGIGIAAAAAPLHVESTSATEGIKVRNPGGSAAGITFRASADGFLGTVGADSSGAYLWAPSNQPISFRFAGTEKARVHYNGYIGVSTANPTHSIHTAGGILALSSITALGGFYGDGSMLTGVPGDNLGNHAATAALNMGGFNILSVSTISVSGENVVLSPFPRDGNYDYAISIGSGTGLNYTSGIGIGYGAFNNYNNGVGIGRSSDNNYTFGVGVGNMSHSNSSYGVGVGYYANTNNGNGVGVGYIAANNSNYGVGVGANAGSNSNYGVGLGANASGNSTYAVGIGAYSQSNAPYGTGVGAYSSAKSSSAALGYYARAANQEALALGAGAKANAMRSVCVGAYCVNDATDTVKIRENYTLKTDSVTISGFVPQLVVSTNVYVVGYSSAARYYGDGSGLTGVSATDASKVAKAGDAMTGQLSVYGSSVTVAPASGATAMYLRETGASISSPMLLAEDTAGTGEPQLEVKSNNYRGRMSIAGSNGYMYMGTLTNNPLMLQVNSLQTARFAVDGKVGIGQTAPAEAFDVHNRIVISTMAGGNNTFDGLFSYGTSGIQFNSNGVTYLRALYNATNLVLGSNTVYSGAGQAKVQVNGSMSVGPVISMYAAPSNGLIVEGRVGIGTATPTALLDVRDQGAGNGFVLRVGTGTASDTASLVVTTGGIVGVGTLFPSTQTVFHAQAVATDKTPGAEDVTLGLMGSVRAYGTGSEDAAAGGDFEARADGVENVGHLVGIHTSVERTSGGTGFVSKAIGLFVDEVRNSNVGTGKITDTYGVYIATMATDNQTNAPYSLYAMDQNARSYFAGKVGFGTANPQYALEVSSAAGSSDKILMVSTGTVEIFSVKGNGEVYTKGKFIGDGSLLTNVNSSNVIINGSGLSIATSPYAGASGVFISSGGAIQTAGAGHGPVAGNARGMGAVDLQTYRVLPSEAATGNYSIIAGGFRNTASAEQAAVLGGSQNNATNQQAVVVGGYNNGVSGSQSTIGGGASNSIAASEAFVGNGYFNRVETGADNSAITGGYGNQVYGKEAAIGGGRYNLVSASNSVVAGGAFNVVSGTSSVVAGGEGNAIGGFQKYISIGGGYMNSATGQYSRVGGGWDNRATAWGASIGGGIFNRVSDSYATVAGGSTNTAGGYGAFVGAGDLNQAIAGYSAVVGGTYNNAYGGYSFVGGGAFHTVDTIYSAVAGGRENKIAAGGDYAFIGGGDKNRSSGAYSFVGGGGPGGGVTGNTVDGPYSAIVGGSSNTISSVVNAGFIGGGADNHLYGDSATVGGGQRNIAGVAGSKFYGAVLGGHDNQAVGEASFVGGGNYNIASGQYSAVPGGAYNSASGDYSLAAGFRSSSTVSGTFSWADSEGYPLINDVPDQARFKAKGGFWVAISTDYSKPGLFVSSANNVSMGVVTGGPGTRLTVIEPNPQPNAGNGEVLRVGTGPSPGMLTVSTSGVVNMPQQSVAIASAPPMALASTGWNIINSFSFEELDTQNEMFPAGFTARSPGRYLVTFDATMNCSIANNTVGVGVTINGEAIPARYATSYVGATGQSAVSFSHVFSLGAGSLVQFYFYNTLASAFNNFVPMVTVTKLQ